MDYNKFKDVHPNSRYKVTGFVTNVPQELTFYVNVHGSQRAEIEKKIAEARPKVVDGAFKQYTVGNPRLRVDTEEGYTIFLKDITAYKIERY